MLAPLPKITATIERKGEEPIVIEFDGPALTVDAALEAAPKLSMLITYAFMAKDFADGLIAQTMKGRVLEHIDRRD